MACSFSIPFAGDAGSLVANIKSKILANNGSFDGSDSAGMFAIEAVGASIQGNYTVNGNELVIVVDKKPFFVSCNMIRDYVMANITG